MANITIVQHPVKCPAVIEREDWERIKAIAKQRGVSAAMLVRTALERWLDANRR